MDFEVKEIEDGAAPPDARKRSPGRPPAYPFRTMRAGTYFDVLVRPKENLNAQTARVRSAAHTWRLRNKPGFSFVVRSLDAYGEPLFNDAGKQVIRVWAIEAPAPKTDISEFL